jgi:hypothetical protein
MPLLTERRFEGSSLGRGDPLQRLTDRLTHFGPGILEGGAQSRQNAPGLRIRHTKGA